MRFWRHYRLKGDQGSCLLGWWKKLLLEVRNLEVRLCPCNNLHWPIKLSAVLQTLNRREQCCDLEQGICCLSSDLPRASGLLEQDIHYHTPLTKILYNSHAAILPGRAKIFLMLKALFCLKWPGTDLDHEFPPTCSTVQALLTQSNTGKQTKKQTNKNQKMSKNPPWKTVHKLQKKPESPFSFCQIFFGMCFPSHSSVVGIPPSQGGPSLGAVSCWVAQAVSCSLSTWNDDV